MPTKRYFPALSELMPLSGWKESWHLDFIKNAITSVFDKIHYKDLQISKSRWGDSAFYSLKLISKDRIDFEIPGTGVFLVLNPDNDLNNISSFPITLSYNWQVLRLIKSFDEGNFTATAEEFFDLANQVLNLSDDLVVAHAINRYVVPQNENSRTQQLANDIGDQYNVTITVPTTGDIITQLTANIATATGDNASIAIFNTYIADPDGSIAKQNLRDFFDILFSGNVESYLLDYITPKIKATLLLSAAIEFPRTWMVPVNPQTLEPEPEDPGGLTPRAQFTFADALLTISTETGFGFELGFALSTTKPVMIGKTGLIANIKNLKLDLSDSKNIPEIDADGRPVDFKGVYIEKCEIYLPPNWSNTGNNPKIVAENLIAGSEGGLSGKISVEGYHFEHFVDFEISNTSQITILPEEKRIKITGANNKEHSIDYTSGGKDIYIRDLVNPPATPHFYKVDGLGNITSGLTAPVGILKYSFANGLSISLDTFNIEFRQNKVISSSVSGTLTIPSFDAPIKVIVDFDNGFLIKAYVPNGKSIVNNKSVEIILNGLEIGKVNDISRFGFSGKALVKSENPFVEKFIPNSIVVNRLLYQSDNTLEFDVGIGWKSGFSVTGNDENGLQIVIPISRKSDKDPAIKIDSIKIVAKKQNGELDINTSLIGASLNIGVVTATVNGLGFKTEITFPEGGGNLGDANAKLALLPPTGIGIRVEGGAVTGGGFLDFDSENGRYSGALDLAFTELSLAAIGILVTKLPSGKKGFSLLAIISVKFTPAIQLGYGFTLNKVGGILGLHRIMNADNIRAGVRDGSMTKVMFPTEPSKNAPTIISQLESYFPTSEGTFVFGPMAEIGWGTPTLISLELALIIQINPFNIGIAGLIKCLLPTAEEALLKLQVAFFGEINIPKKFIKFDASIFDSTLLTFSLSGDMVARVFWGDKGGFLISVGGFHPSFTVPAEMEVKHPVRRLTITLIDTGNFRIKSETYFAITSNTVQFGTKVDLYAGFSEFSISGLLQFDALIYFKPKFSFEIDLHASVAAKAFGKKLMGVDVSLHLSGPNNWNARGTGKFEILFIDFEIDFNETWGERKADNEPPAINVYNLFENTIKEKNNWELVYEQHDSTLVSFRKVDSSDLIYLPGSVLTFNQRTIPLDVPIDKYGNHKVERQNPVDGKDKFEIKKIELWCADEAHITPLTTNFPLLLEDLKEQFAPGEFFTLSNANDSNAKAQSFLKTPSFQLYKSGATTQLPDEFAAPYDFSYIRRKGLKLQEIYVDSAENDANDIAVVVPEKQDNFNNSQWNNSASLSPLSQFTDAAVAFSPFDSYSVTSEKFIIVNTETFDLYNQIEYGTENEAAQALKYLINDNTIQAGDYMVLPDYELAI